MKDYYSILGIQRGATEGDIKKAFRRKAMESHPDRGGNESDFKLVNEAYEVLSDPQKRQTYDLGGDPKNPNQQHFRNQGFDFHFNGMPPGMEQFFTNFGFGFQGFDNRPRNRALNVNLTITLEEAYTGAKKDLQLRYPNGNDKIINIEIPPGVGPGAIIKYNGLGDDSIPGVPPGDLTISIQIMNHPHYQREGDNLITSTTIDCFDAIVGTTTFITTLDGRTLEVTVPPGTQAGATLGAKNEGMPSRAGGKGKLYIKVNVSIPQPQSLTIDQLNTIKQWKGK